jgi:WD40 repeat protein
MSARADRFGCHMKAARKRLALARLMVGPILLLVAWLAAATVRAQDAAAERLMGGREKSARADRHGDALPEGVLARLGTVRLRAVWAPVGLSPDGKTIITVANGRHIKFWDADTGKLCGQRELPVGPSHPAFLSPDGRILATREPDFDTPIDIWDTASGKRLRQLRLPEMPGIYRAVFSPDGKRLAVAESGAGETLRLWDVGSGEHRVLTGHPRGPESLAFAAAGKLLATAEFRRVICWDAAKVEQLWRAEVAAGSLAFTPDGRMLITSPHPRGRVWHCWDAATGKPAEGVKLPEGYSYARFAVAPDGRTLVFAQPSGITGADGRVRLWDLRAGKLLRTLPVAGQIGPFSRDGLSVLTNDGAVQRWELATGRPLLPDTDALGHRAEVGRVVYSPDGRRLASAAHDGTVRLWEVATAKPLHVLRGHEQWVTELAFTPDSKLLVSSATDGELRVWDVEAGREVRRIPLHDPRRGEKKQNVWRLHVTPDGQTIIVLGYDSMESGAGAPEEIITSWDLASGRRKASAPSQRNDGFYTAFSPDGRLLASHGLLLDTATGTERTRLEDASKHSGAYAFSPDGRLLAGLITRPETDGVRFTTKMVGIQLWDSSSGRAVRRIPTDWVGQPTFSPDGRYLAAAGQDGIRLWELATGEVVVRHIAHERMQGSFGLSFASCLAFAPDGRTLATGHRDSTVLIWGLVPPTRPATAADLPRLWKDLAGSDAAGAHAAAWRLADAPEQALLLLRKQVRPVKLAPAEQTRPLLADLDSDDFDRREAASARLRELGDRARVALRQARKAGPALEKRKRLEALLKALEETPSGETLGELRAVAVLERIGTREARELLEELAAGDPEARLTREAKVSLERLAKRHAWKP